jgi:hypothetical protein
VATVFIREYADIAVTGPGKVIQAGAEPGLADQTVTTSATTAPSNAFNANTRVIAITTPATAVACLFGVAGATPTALITSLRLPANSMFFFGVIPGAKVALIDVT